MIGFSATNRHRKQYKQLKCVCVCVCKGSETQVNKDEEVLAWSGPPVFAKCEYLLFIKGFGKYIYKLQSLVKSKN